MSKLKICFFGSYEQGGYNELLKKILKKSNLEIIECHAPITNLKSFFSAYLKLLLKHRSLNYDIMVIPWRGITTFPLAKLICRKPIIYIGFISIYDTLINDRKLYKKNSLLSKVLFNVDKFACKWSNVVVTETFASRDYFVSEFNVDKKNFRRIFLSADENKFPKLEHKSPSNEFIVLFFGSFIPLHGIDVIIKAAKILKTHLDIKFKFCGKGQMFREMKELVNKYQLKNVEFLGFVSHQDLQQNLKNSDLCLGIFDKGKKAENVVTNKVFQILSSGKPLLTMKSKATQEICLENRKNCILIPPNDSQKLADSILELKNNPNVLLEIAKNGNLLFLKQLNMKHTGNEFIKLFNSLLIK